MAHAAKLSQLAENLITSIAGTHGDHAEVRQLQDRTLKGLKNTSHARTNQFDVESKLDGLVEKLAVRNREDLAEGLQSRLNELPERSKWLPEMLSLLLELSDRPLEKTRFEDVEAASRVDEKQPALTWKDIIADDPLDETDIWDDIEHGYHSSDDDFTTEDDASGDETQATSVAEDDPVTLARRHVVQLDNEALSRVEGARGTLEGTSSGLAVSELVLIRETLCMLHGLPTNIYNLDDITGTVGLGGDVKLATASKCILRHTLQGLAGIGSSLNALRRWVKREQIAPTLRSCQGATSSGIARLARHLAMIEQRFLTTEDKGVSSLIDVRTDVESLAQPFLVLARLMQEHTSDYPNAPVALLDRLYDETCIAQLSGDSEAFAILTSVLSAGLNTYLRPVSRWIAGGECDSHADFFVVEADSDCDLTRLWHDRYALRQDKDGEAAAPTFLQPFVARIFALGKGRAFLKAVTRDEEEVDVGPTYPSLDMHAAQADLLPFSQMLADALETWITEQSRDQTPLLRTAILEGHGLLATVDDLQGIFFSQNGRRFQTFADTLFWRLDNVARWRNGFLLTELAQSTLGSAEGVVAESLTVQVANDCSDATVAESSESSIRKLQDLHLHYHLPWPLQNVTASPSSPTYSRACTSLLQTYRAKYLLRQHVFTLRHPNSQPSSPSPPPAIQTALKLHQRLSTIVDILYAHITQTSALLSTVLQRDLSAAEGIDAMATTWQRHERELAVSLLVAGKLAPVREAVLGVLGLCERVMGIFERLAAGGEAEGGDSAAEVREMQKELESSLAFVTAGLRGIGRAGGNAALGQLAERLEWAVH